MTMTDYAIAIEVEDGIFQVSCRDLPGLISAGPSAKEALTNAADALDVLVGYLIDKGHDLPAPSPAEAGEVAIALPTTLAAKAAIYRAWKASGISKSELARRMGVADNEAHRVLDARHPTKLDRLDQAARVFGKRLVVGMEDMAA
jgi:antitoxin HicB